MNHKFNYLILSLLIMLISGCENSEPEKPIARTLSIDPASINNIQELGRVLFYDKNLSLNNTISCGSCHKQEFSFADNTPISLGFVNTTGKRNTPAILNISGGILNIDNGDCIFQFDEIFCNSRQAGSLFWDGRESDLNTMVLRPVTDHIEMGFKDLNQLEKRIASIDYYQTAFNNVFGKSTPTINEIGGALATFVRSIRTTTKFERSMAGEERLSALEQKGLELFFSKYQCNQCHQTQSAHGYRSAMGGSFANIGLDPSDEDYGLMNTTGEEEDLGKFKIPSLRNVEYTAPYMHDGRFETLEEVIDHYSNGLSDNDNLDERLEDELGGPLVLTISNLEKQAIVAFLKTLSDPDVITNPSLSDPFQ